MGEFVELLMSGTAYAYVARNGSTDNLFMQLNSNMDILLVLIGSSVDLATYCMPILHKAAQNVFSKINSALELKAIDEVAAIEA
jgi:hypothetical protein